MSGGWVGEDRPSDLRLKMRRPGGPTPIARADDVRRRGRRGPCCRRTGGRRRPRQVRSRPRNRGLGGDGGGLRDSCSGSPGPCRRWADGARHAAESAGAPRRPRTPPGPARPADRHPSLTIGLAAGQISGRRIGATRTGHPVTRRCPAARTGGADGSTRPVKRDIRKEARRPGRRGGRSLPAVRRVRLARSGLGGPGPGQEPPLTASGPGLRALGRRQRRALAGRGVCVRGGGGESHVHHPPPAQRLPMRL
jgi:hypothetical protein